MASITAILPVVAVLFALFAASSGLKCYECGVYIEDERIPVRLASQVLPCLQYDESDLKECKATEKACLKYVNKDIVVRSCAQNCNQDINAFAEREIHCCDGDGCNAGPSLGVTWLTLAACLVLGFWFAKAL